MLFLLFVILLPFTAPLMGVLLSLIVRGRAPREMITWCAWYYVLFLPACVAVMRGEYWYPLAIIFWLGGLAMGIVFLIMTFVNPPGQEPRGFQVIPKDPP